MALCCNLTWKLCETGSREAGKQQGGLGNASSLKGGDMTYAVCKNFVVLCAGRRIANGYPPLWGRQQLLY